MIRENAAEDVQHEVDETKKHKAEGEENKSETKPEEGSVSLNKKQKDCDVNDVDKKEENDKLNENISSGTELGTEVKTEAVAKPVDDSSGDRDELWKEVQIEFKNLIEVYLLIIYLHRIYSHH